MNLVCAGSFGNIVLVASGRCGTDALPLKLFLPCAQLSGGWREFLENYSTKMHITLQVRSGQVCGGRTGSRGEGGYVRCESD